MSTPISIPQAALYFINMSSPDRDKSSDKDVKPSAHGRDEEVGQVSQDLGAQKYAYSDSRKIGVTGAVFLIINKMIGTGSEHLHPGRLRLRHPH